MCLKSEQFGLLNIGLYDEDLNGARRYMGEVRLPLSTAHRVDKAEISGSEKKNRDVWHSVNVSSCKFLSNRIRR